MKYLYSIDNNLTGKRYIGVTIDPERRWKQHTNPKVKKNSAIKDAINSYGKENFTFTLLCFDEDEVIDKLEVETIKHFNTQVPNGYNFTLGGDGASYRKWDDSWNKLLGTVSDVELGKQLGYHASTIGARREGLCIAPYTRYPVIDWSKWDHLLGKDKDKTIAEKMGVSSSTVGARRSLMGVAPFTRPVVRHKYPQELLDSLGKMTDVELETIYGIPASCLSRKRKSLGIKRKVGYQGHKKRIWGDEELKVLHDPSITAEDVVNLLNTSVSTVHKYRREFGVGKYTGTDKRGRLNYIPLEGEFLEDMLNEKLTNKEVATKHNYKLSTIWAKRKSKGFLKIKGERE